MRIFWKRSLIAAVLFVTAGASAFADGMGTLGFADIGDTTVDTGQISTATVFNIADFTSTLAQTGDFVGFPSADFGPISFDITNPTSFTLSNAVFGTFTSTAIIEFVNSPGTVAVDIVGNYMGGTFNPLIQGPASMTISFTQTPPSTGSISASGTFSIPSAVDPLLTVPEPSTFALGMLGLTAFAVLSRKTRSNRQVAA